MKLDTIIATPDKKVVYRDGDQAIKVFDESYKKSDVLNEALNTARVEETGLAVPPIYEVTKIDGKWAIVMKYIPGKTLLQMMKENPEHKEAYMERFVKLQMSVHEKTSPLLNTIKAKMRRKINETGLDATTRYELFLRLESMPTHHKVCHGDFNPSNIIVGEDGTDYILDWSHVTQGNAGADAARTYLVYSLFGDTEGAEMYMKTFCKLSDTPRQYVQKWLPIVAASQLVKSRPGEREFLLNWVDVVEY